MVHVPSRICERAHRNWLPGFAGVINIYNSRLFLAVTLACRLGKRIKPKLRNAKRTKNIYPLPLFETSSTASVEVKRVRIRAPPEPSRPRFARPRRFLDPSKYTVSVS